MKLPHSGGLSMQRRVMLAFCFPFCFLTTFVSDYFRTSALFAICLLGIGASTAVDALGDAATAIEGRKDEINQLVLNRNIQNRYTLPILAFLGQFPLDETVVDDLVAGTAASSNSDFGTAILVRILFFTENTEWKQFYDDKILPTLEAETYWFTTDCCLRNDDSMASENHMILWFSSAWLLQQREGWLMGPTLRQRLVHWLNLKIEYGYYEFLSASYWPLSFQGLMNLIDFCQDDEIRSLAEQAARRLVADNLLFLNSKGIKYSVAGRDYAERFTVEAPHSLVQDGLFYILKGLGPEPSLNVRASAFLSTSSFDFSAEVEQWQPSGVDTIVENGHTLEESFEINADLDRYDRIAFQFSQGMFFEGFLASYTRFGSLLTVPFVLLQAPIFTQTLLKTP